MVDGEPPFFNETPINALKMIKDCVPSKMRHSDQVRSRIFSLSWVATFRSPSSYGISSIVFLLGLLPTALRRNYSLAIHSFSSLVTLRVSNRSCLNAELPNLLLKTVPEKNIQLLQYLKSTRTNDQLVIWSDQNNASTHYLKISFEDSYQYLIIYLNIS